MTQYILALDQGTTSSRAIVFGREGQTISMAQLEVPQIIPGPGQVQHDPEVIWSTQLQVARQALEKASLTARDIAALGVTNQRETTILWDRATGQPVDHAVVWLSRVSAPLCEQLRREGMEGLFREKTGLLLDPYFSATRVKYLLDRHDGLRARARRGDVLFGTVDSYLMWRLTGGRRHVTDVSNASRTLLYNIHQLDWDDELLSILDIPRAMLPDVRPTSHVYGETDPGLFGAPIPIAAAAGDQQAATFGQACFQPGSAKNTYGTGCFLLLNTGSTAVASHHHLLTTIGWQIGNRTTYCLEGSVFVGGAVVQWLRDGLGLIRSSREVEALATSVPDSGGVYFVPALAGLGAPHWDPYARGTILGITLGTTSGHLARAALESIALQTRDLIDAMRNDSGVELSELKVDGGASTNNTLLQFQADVLGVPVRRPVVAETTALGAAYLAGLAVGYWPDVEAIAQNWVLDRQFEPAMGAAQREQRCRQWQRAVARSLRWEAGPLDPYDAGAES